jgi:serine O-acetyltransferase
VKVKKDLNHTDLPDPVADRIKDLEAEIARLRKEIESLKKERKVEDEQHSTL